MFSEVLNSIKAYLYDKAASPLLGSLAISLALWNFKILMLFFSGTSYAVKVWEMDYFYSQPFFLVDGLSWLTNYWMCVYILPVLTALFYIYVFPRFSHKVFEYSYNKQIDLNNKKKQLQESELITEEEKRELLSRIESLNIEHRAAVIKLRQEISELESQLDTVINEREELQQQVQDSVVSSNVVFESDDETADRAMEELTKKAEDLIKGRITPKTNQYDPSFYLDANEDDKELYMAIISDLYLGKKPRGSITEYQDSHVAFALPVLLMEGLVSSDESDDVPMFSITETGKEFYADVKRKRLKPMKNFEIEQRVLEGI